ncbi:DinB family protein [Catenulispora subtropica]|uniref:DinB family protein n=1 Tax=Catenulispora subtropica TaxID=450798 RepID=A0ABN2RVQ9_9ACTN
MSSESEWTAPVVDRRENVPADTERESLDRYLDWHRETLLWKCGGLSGEQLASRPLGTTNLSLLGLLRHMALVERAWFRQRFAGDSELGLIYSTDENPDGDFDNGTAESAEADYGVYLAEVELARKAVAGRGLDELFPGRSRELTLRWLYLHMIEEYARHLGHADLLREAIDGARGD